MNATLLDADVVSEKDMPPSEARRFTVRSGTLSLAAWSRGDSRRPVVVLVHGYPDSSAVWDAVADDLARDFHVVTYDVRGAGESDIPPRREDYRLELLADDLQAVIDTVSPGMPVHVVAHDWGSIQSWEAVCRESLRERIASFTSVSGPSLDHAGFWLRQRLFNWRPLAWLELIGQLLRSWYVFLIHVPGLVPLAWRAGLAGFWPRLLRLAEGAKAKPSATRLQDGRNGVNLYRANFLPRLFSPQRRFTLVPVQLLLPTREHYVSPHINDDLLEWAPSLWRHEISSGHWPQLTCPQALAQRVRQFAAFVESGEESAELLRARVVDKSRQKSAQEYAGKLVVVTGGGSGIGRETLLDFAQRGAVVVAVDISPVAAERTAMLARLLGAEAHAFCVDVGSAEAMNAFAETLQAQLGTPDIVVNNAGIGLAGAFLDTETEDWQRVLNVNLWGVIHGSRLFGRQMLAAGKPGSIVNVASAAAFSPNRILSAYATSKAAVFMLNDCLRAELTGRGIDVITVCPGFVDTGITTSTRFVGVSDSEQQRRRDASKRLYQLRNLRPQAVALAIRRGVDSGRAVVLVGAEARSMHFLNGHAPWLTRAMARVDLTP